MAEAYSPGLTVTHHAVLRRVRELPLPGKTLVAVGQRVVSTTPVLSAELAGEIEIVRVADKLGFEPAAIVQSLLVKPGDVVAKGQVICEKHYFFNMFTAKLAAPCDGTVEFFTAPNGHLGIRQPPTQIAVDAYIDGTVVEVVPGKSVEIETSAALLQGIFGVGGEKLGIVRPLPVALDATVTRQTLEPLGENLSKAILVGGKEFTLDALRFALERNVAGVITGSVDSDTLTKFVGHEIGVSMTGDEDLALTFFITEGFGSLALSQRVFDVAQAFAGKTASINGATQVRAGAVRPELIIPHEGRKNQQGESPHSLEVGIQVRCTREPFFGCLGTIEDLPVEPQLLESGAKVRVASVRLEDGKTVFVPRANIEIERR